MVGAAPVDQLLVSLELVAAVAEPAGVDALVDVAAGLRTAHHLGGGLGVVRIGGADEPIGADREPVERCLPGRGPRVDQLVRVDAGLARVPLDVGRVLVEAGQEAHIAADEPLVAGDRVGADRLEQRVEGGPWRGIEDRGREVEAFALGHRCSRPFGQYSSLRTCSGGKPRSVAISSIALTMSGFPHR